ncbi:MAG: hypothetical protein ACLGI9_09380 [Thermoanaerobaculia bacterium]
MLRKLWMVSAAFALTAAAQVGTASSNGCPPPQPYEGVCAQVIVWAKDPATGMCCQYPNPCSVPAGWEIYYGPHCTNPEIEGF